MQSNETPVNGVTANGINRFKVTNDNIISPDEVGLVCLLLHLTRSLVICVFAVAQKLEYFVLVDFH